MTSCNALQTERPTNTDALGEPNPTAPPGSRARDAGNAWYCRLMCQAAPASSDAARFLAGLES